jgi:tRNA A37 threonylcarbamoyladenosine dehydratase
MLNQKLAIIQNDINDMNNITGFKKMVSEHTRINKELNDNNEYVNSLMETITKSKTDVSVEEIPDINDEQYVQYIEDLKNCSELFDKIENIEDQMKLYFDSMYKVKLVVTYLNKRKTDIITIT